MQKIWGLCFYLYVKYFTCAPRHSYFCHILPLLKTENMKKASLSEVWLNSPKGWTFCNLWIPISFLSCFKVKLWWFRAWAWLIQSCASGGRSCQTFIILSSSARLQQQPEEYLGSECLLPESEICILCPRVFREAAELVTIFRYQNIPPQPQWLQHLDSDISQHISAWIQTLSLSHKMGNVKGKKANDYLKGFIFRLGRSCLLLPFFPFFQDIRFYSDVECGWAWRQKWSMIYN